MIQKLHNLFGKRIVDMFFITLGSFIVAFGFNAFLLPNRIVSGGINGLTIILYETLRWSPSVILFVANGLLLALCLIFLGREVFVKSLLGSMLSPLFVSLLKGVDLGVNDPLLASLYGGVTVGIGVGIVFLGNGSTGGTSILALLLQKVTNLRIGILLGFCDGLVILCALFVFDLQIVLVSLISLYLASRMVDTVQVGPDLSKSIYIISDHYDVIGRSLVKDLGLGITYIAIEGGLNQDPKRMIMTVIREQHFINIKQHVLSLDPEAFITITSANEVVGRGFTLFDTDPII